MLKFEGELSLPGIEPGSSGLPRRDANRYTIWLCWKIYIISFDIVFYFFKNRSM